MHLFSNVMLPSLGGRFQITKYYPPFPNGSQPLTKALPSCTPSISEHDFHCVFRLGKVGLTEVALAAGFPVQVVFDIPNVHDYINT